VGELTLANETAQRRRAERLLPVVALPPAIAPPPDCARLLMPGGEHREIAMPEGASIQEIIDGALAAELHQYVRVYANGTEVADWPGFRTRSGDRLVVAVVPGGGKNKKGIIGAILTIVVAVFAPYVAGFMQAGVWGATATGLVGSALTVGVTLVGAMVISALVKPPTISTSGSSGNAASSQPSSYQLTGQSNAARPFNSCFVVYGRHKVMPALAANPDVDNWGNGTTITALYDFGLGYLQIEDLRIGDVAASEYSPQLVLHQFSLCRDLQLYTNRIGYDQYQVVQARNDPFVATTKAESYCANLDIQFPGGVYQQTQNASITFWADFAAKWRKAGTDAWNDVPIDWYYGSMGREYTMPYDAFIQWRPPDTVWGVWGGNAQPWTDYYPDSSPALMRKAQADVLGANIQVDIYGMSKPNPLLQFQYPNGGIDATSYWARNQDARRRWPENRSAQDHFESVGSREGREPGVTVRIIGADGINYGYAASDGNLRRMLHEWDVYRFMSDPYVGAWGWINNGSPPAPPMQQIEFEWQFWPGYAWDEQAYLARYPDVANAVASGAFPSGWVHFQKAGAMEGRDPYVHNVDHAVRLSANWVGVYWMRIFFQFPEPGTYELWVMRTDRIQDGTDTSIAVQTGGSIVRRVNQSVIGILRSYQWGLPVLPRLPHTMLEMRVRASEQLSGVVQNLSAIATSVLQVTDDGANFWWAATRNPAWIGLDILVGEKNPKRLSRDAIEWASWIHLSRICDTPRSWVANGQPFTGPRYTCDVVVADFTTVKDLVESVLSSCRASLVLTTAGLWGVLHDEEKTVPRQLITPANSWGFSGQRTFATYPHALRVNFINRDAGWNTDEIIVYADGYNADNATIFETLDTYGITDWPHAWAYGRYMLAQGILRSELFTVTMDVENLLVQRGDLVQVAHDVPRIGGMPTRVDTVFGTGGGGGVVVRCNVDFSLVPTGYSLRRNADDAIISGAVLAINPETQQLELDANAASVQPDDLLVLGTYDRVVSPYLVQSIAPGQDYSAELTLVKYDPDVYNADIGALPVWEPDLSPDMINSTDLVVKNVTASWRLYYVNREPRIEIALAWITTGSLLAWHNITLITQSGQRIVIAQQHQPQSLQWLIDALREATFVGVPLQFEVAPFSTGGLRGAPGYVTVQVEGDHTPPAAVPMFGANVQKENIDLFWKPPDEPDVGQYLLRYTPETIVPNWDASQHLATLAYPTTKTSAGARTGSYGLRVVDTSGNVSPVVWRRTTVEFLPEINVIEVVNDRETDPPWTGKLSHVEVHGGEIWSAGDFGSVYPDGIYYMEHPVDLGDVFEVRISSKLKAYGVTAQDYMVAWQPLASVAAMSSGAATSDLWDAWLEIRTANQIAMMAEWAALAAVDPMADGAQGSWSEWRPCVVGDFTARLVQMRFVLESRNPGVRVVIFDGRVELDMPDRIDSYPDVPVTPGGAHVLFDPAFRELRSIAISIDGNPDPVSAETSDKDSTGVTVRLRNTITGEYTSGKVDVMVEGFGRLRPDSI